MSKVIEKSMIVEILKSVQEKGIDLSNPEAINEFTNELQAKPTKGTHNYNVPEDNKRCMARVWGSGSGLDRCKKGRKDNTEFCTMHLKEWNQGHEPCSHDANGQKFGLFCGRIDEPIPYKNGKGEITIRWESEEMKSLIASELSKGIKSAPNTKEGHKENGTKHIPLIKRIRKPKAVGEQASAEEPKTKVSKKGKSKKDANAPKRATNAFMFFTNEKREEVKAKLLADFLAINPEADEKSQKAAITVGKVAQAIGLLWKEISDEGKTAYKTLETADKARYELEMTAYKSSKAIVSIVNELPAEEKEEEKEVEEPESAEEGLECDEIEIDGETYLVDGEQNVYDIDCNPLGKLVEGKIVA
jgi:hypothetical protein